MSRRGSGQFRDLEEKIELGFGLLGEVFGNISLSYSSLDVAKNPRLSSADELEAEDSLRGRERRESVSTNVFLDQERGLTSSARSVEVGGRK